MWLKIDQFCVVVLGKMVSHLKEKDMIPWPNVTKRRRVDVISKKVSSMVPDNPEGKLMFAIFDMALSDLVYVVPPKPKYDLKKHGVMTPDSKKKFVSRMLNWTNSKNEAERNRSSAKRYLKSDMIHLCACDVDTDWVKQMLVGANLIAHADMK